MDLSDKITLISESYTEDAIGQRVPVETPRTIFCKVESVTRSEWTEAGRNGLKAEYRATVFAPEYAGEEIAELNGARYGIYRTYRARNETMELYLERKAGV